jgi:hypothetical protein
MESGFRPDPLQAIRDQAAAAARRFDLTSEAGQAAARGWLDVLDEADRVEASRAAARLFRAQQYLTLGAVAALSLVATGAIVWALFHGDYSPQVRVASVAITTSACLAVLRQVFKHAEAQLLALRRRGETSGAEPAAELPPATQQALMRRLLRLLPGRTR